MNRRKFLSSIYRGTILTGLTALSGILIYKNVGKSEDCTFDFVCRDCRKLKGCKQPEAIIFKRKIEKNTTVK
ncbi:hypothetical protein ACFLS4_00940 [Bacteroidota bacterium]